MKKVLLLLLCGFLFLLVGCADDPATPTAIAETVATPEPTNTPTLEPTATSTSSPTATATHTATPTPTLTATATATPSPVPTATPTATATQTPTPTPTLPPATPRPVSLPAVGSPPSGPNLLTNPGFESGIEGWQQRSAPSIAVINNMDWPSFVHSGTNSAVTWSLPQYPPSFSQTGFQRVTNVVPGTTYRFGIWVKIWSSTGDDHLISENPGDFVAQICINTVGDDDPALPTTLCSGFYRPLDAWQFVTFDAVATSDAITVMYRSFFSGGTRPKHNVAYWDDAALGVAPVPATPTPLPPSRPAPIPFHAAALRDNMLALRSTLQQLGGLLDRLVNGQGGTCSEFQGYYAGMITIPTYESIPAEWQGIYNDYLYAADHGLETNSAINDLCVNGRGTLSSFNFGLARSGINESIDRLSPAIEAANALLGQ